MNPGPSVVLRRARPEEADALAEISTRAFHSDHAVGGPVTGGPPGYDDPAWQQRMMSAGRYHALVVDEALVGGAIVFGTGPASFELGRIFLDPEQHGRGIGKQAMALLFAAYPGARRWTLDTPVWNRRTRRFYEGLGFVEVGRSQEPGGPELVVYQKEMEPR